MIHPDDIMERYLEAEPARQEAINDLLSTNSSFAMMAVLDSGKGSFKGMLKTNLNDANIIVPAIINRFRQLYGDVWLASIRGWLDDQNIS